MQESLLTFPKRLAARSYYVSVAIHTPLDPRFRKPPSHPGRSDFPSPVGSNGISFENLPIQTET
jgi:hypothetical protein